MKNVHFIAIGGAAMHNLALALNEKEGYKITGSDDEIFEPSRSRLAAAGLLPEKFGWFPERITTDLDAVILGMHARADNPELLRAKELGLKIYSFPEYLYEQTKNKTRVVIGGSHGKTTTTAMILFVLKRLGIAADFMVGAQIEGFTNMVSLSDDANIAVFEGDEYLTSPIDLRPKFHLYRPNIALLTGIAWDHVNVFPTFDNYVEQFRIFADLIEVNGKLIFFDGDENLRTIAASVRKDITTIAYNTPVYKIVDGRTVLQLGGHDVPLQIFGEHNLQNMMGAYAVCTQLGVSRNDFFDAMQHFGGAANRLQKVAETPVSVAFKDFAHSPSKLKASIKAVKTQYPDRQLLACMELHTFSSLTKDFLPQYAGTMSDADEAFVYFDPTVIAHKQLEAITPEEVTEAFGGNNVQVFIDTQALQARLREIDFTNKNLLLMSSGNFSGVNLTEFAQELLRK
ncbi:MAG: Mur ligase domain-containing protein [Prevotellaceae bacterium]|jgi:UDP-N-acetylmuramate: L-alanyl-gamma-D-glutamyl-meso-diaminopimelate ligase|nr:Mur ligase domain-containing protein [Prevotellaceae bacterium]